MFRSYQLEVISRVIDSILYPLFGLLLSGLEITVALVSTRFTLYSSHDNEPTSHYSSHINPLLDEIILVA